MAPRLPAADFAKMCRKSRTDVPRVCDDRNATGPTAPRSPRRTPDSRAQSDMRPGGVEFSSCIAPSSLCDYPGTAVNDLLTSEADVRTASFASADFAPRLAQIH